MASKANFISKYRQEAIKLAETLEAMDNLKAEYDSQGYSSSLVDGDFTAQNADITAQQFKDGLGNVETFRASFFSSNFQTNVFRLRY